LRCVRFVGGHFLLCQIASGRVQFELLLEALNGADVKITNNNIVIRWFIRNIPQITSGTISRCLDNRARLMKANWPSKVGSDSETLLANESGIMPIQRNAIDLRKNKCSWLIRGMVGNLEISSSWTPFHGGQCVERLGGALFPRTDFVVATFCWSALVSLIFENLNNAVINGVAMTELCECSPRETVV
jgi:hypothetical protein